jgi:hypothetical protein
MALTAIQRQSLLDALTRFFTVEDQEIRILVQTVFDAPLDQLTPALVTLKDKLERIVDAADNQRLVGRLLDEVARVRPGRAAEVEQMRADLIAVVAAERLNHFAAARLMGNNYMVDREPLRDKLKLLANPDEGIHILRVFDGKPDAPATPVKKVKSGKSYSFQMIRYLENRLGGFQVIYVDLSQLAAPLNRALLPEDLAEDIIPRMGLRVEDMPARQNEQDSRWAQRFAAWLTGELRQRHEQYWIVLDNFSGTLVPAGVYDLIQKLAEEIETNLGQLRLVLLGYERELPDTVVGGLEEEDLAQAPRLGSDHLLRFFAGMYQERKLRRNVDFEPADVAASVSAVMQKVDFTQDDYLPQLGKAVIQEGRHIWSAA